MKTFRPARGQALAEFLVLAAALMPLFLLLPMIGKYQDIAHASQSASRYAAFDATTRNDGSSGWKPEAQLAAELRRRFFSNSEAPVKTNDTAGNFDAHRNPLWSGPRGDPLIADIDNDVILSFGAGAGPNHASAFQATQDGAPFNRHTSFDLQARGIYRTNVTVRLANLPAGLRYYEPFDAINLVVSRSSSVLLDPWNSLSPDQTDGRVGNDQSIFPSAELQAVGNRVDSSVAMIDAPGGARGPRLGQLEFWQDIVPSDRLR
jgi:hypothetical protein